MNRAKNVNAKHAYLVHRCSGRNNKVRELETTYGKWMEKFQQEANFVGQASRHYGLQRAVCHKTKWAITNHKARGLVKGSYAAEQSLPIGNPCDAELTNLMRCMRENDYDNIPCRALQQVYNKCTTEALTAYKVKKEKFLKGDKTDGMYSQRIINDEFMKIQQPMDWVKNKLEFNYLTRREMFYVPIKNDTHKATKVSDPMQFLPHICEVPDTLNFVQHDRTGKMKKNK